LVTAAIAQKHLGWRFIKRAGNGSSVRAVANTPLLRGSALAVLIALNATFLAAIDLLVAMLWSDHRRVADHATALDYVASVSAPQPRALAAPFKSPW
jgi:hypothetical protein